MERVNPMKGLPIPVAKKIREVNKRPNEIDRKTTWGHLRFVKPPILLRVFMQISLI